MSPSSLQVLEALTLQLKDEVRIVDERWMELGDDAADVLQPPDVTRQQSLFCAFDVDLEDVKPLGFAESLQHRLHAHHSDFDANLGKRPAEVGVFMGREACYAVTGPHCRLDYVSGDSILSQVLARHPGVRGRGLDSEHMPAA